MNPGIAAVARDIDPALIFILGWIVIVGMILSGDAVRDIRRKYRNPSRASNLHKEGNE